MIKQIIGSIKTTRFQESFIFLAVFYIACLLFLQYKFNYSSEKQIDVQTLSETTKEFSSKIEAGLKVNNFPKFSFYKNNFTMDSIVWFSFPMGTESLETISNFSFKNGTIVSKSSPIVQIAGENMIVSYQVRVKFSSKLNFKYFPISNHKLNIILQNKSLSPSEAYFQSESYDLDIEKDLSTGNWQTIDQYVQSGFTQTKLQQSKGTIDASFPTAVFTIDFRNNNFRHFITLYLPLFLIFFVIFISLLIHLDQIYKRISIVVSGIPIMALHSLVIENSSPAGSHITKLDLTYLTVILLALVILAFQSYLGLSVRKFKEKTEEIFTKKLAKLKMINGIMIIFILSALALSITYITFS